MTDPIVTFKQVIPGTLPRRASRSAEGTLPARAMRYCQPVSEASGFGYHLTVPMDFNIVFDGIESVWTWQGQGDNYYPLERVQFPGFADLFDEAAPEGFESFAPPFLVMTEDPGILQIWTGCFARTAPGWSLLVRAPANLDHGHGYEQLEGIIETDRWFGPLFVNVRLKKTGRPIHFRKRHPFLQIQPVQRDTYGEKVLSSVSIQSGFDSLTPQDWEDFKKVVITPTQCPHKLGAYAVRARQRRADERRLEHAAR